MLGRMHAFWWGLRSRARHVVLAGVGVFVTTAPCLWDSDTLDDELRGLPDAFTLIVGRWPRHGPAYYHDRVQRLGAAPALTLAELDDLAVAYEHLGNHELAIATMARKRAELERTPDREHQYRYHANLGTFLAHSGEYDAALVELERALVIEPNAHFGRERFQIDAIRYVAAARQDPELWQGENFLSFAGYRVGLAWWTSRETHAAIRSLDAGRQLETEAAYTAITGMLRFGQRESAELFRALGDVLASRLDLNLAWWAWQRARERDHPAQAWLAAAIATTELHWADAAGHHWSANVPPILADFTRARANADAWLAAFQAAEARALARGETVSDDRVLAALIAVADREVPPVDLSPGLWRRWSANPRARLMAVLVALPILVWLGSVWRARRRRSRAATPG